MTLGTNDVKSHLPAYQFFKQELPLPDNLDKEATEAIALIQSNRPFSHVMNHIAGQFKSSRQLTTAMFFSKLFELQNGAHFEITPKTVEMISKFISIDESLTSNMLVLPNTNTYISLGNQPQDSPYFIKDENGQIRKLQGAFIHESLYEPEFCNRIPFFVNHGIKASKPVRCLNIQLFFSAYDNYNRPLEVPYDVYFSHITLFLYDPEIPIVNLIKQAMDYHKGIFLNHHSCGYEEQSLFENMIATLFFISSNKTRKEIKNEADEIMQALSHTKNKTKIRKMQQRLTRSTNKIVVGESNYDFLTKYSKLSTGSVRPHFRRGHLRLTTKDKKPTVITIWPTLVKATPGAKLPKRDYTV